jgi:transcription elongation factor S-II
VELVQKRAVGIEAAVLKNHDNKPNAAYKGKIRSLFVNLKDKNNPTLREDIVSGEITPEKFAVMTSEVRSPSLSIPRCWLTMGA